MKLKACYIIFVNKRVHLNKDCTCNALRIIDK